MKKYFSKGLLATFIIAMIFMFGGAITLATTVNAQSVNLSQFIELLITLGVIPADKVVAARAMATGLASTTSSGGTVATSTSYVQVLTPNGGESWGIDLDVARSITWGSSGLTQAWIALVPSSSKLPICNLTNAPVTSKNGNHEFNVKLKTAQCFNLTTGTSSPLAVGSYKVRVYYTDPTGITIKDESNAVFKVTPKLIPSLKVTYPNGGETLIRNRDYTVKYKLTNVTNVDDNLIYLYLLDNNGNVAFNSHKTKRSDSTYNLELPSSLSAGAYKIKLKATESTDDIEMEDVSDNFFWISTGL